MDYRNDDARDVLYVMNYDMAVLPDSFVRVINHFVDMLPVDLVRFQRTALSCDSNER